MIYTEELVELDSAMTELLHTIYQSPTMLDYQEAKKNMENDPNCQKKMIAFLEAKNAFESIESYGSYAPGWKEKRRLLRQAKRELDVDDSMAEFRFRETRLQHMLDVICSNIAHTVSDQVKVNTETPFLKLNKSHCGGNCHV